MALIGRFEEKIVLAEHDRSSLNTCKYEVVKLVNRTTPHIGDRLSEEEVQKLMAQSSGTRKVTVEITGAKR